MCICGLPNTLGVVHRDDGPCYTDDMSEHFDDPLIEILARLTAIETILEEEIMPLIRAGVQLMNSPMVKAMGG